MSVMARVAVALGVLALLAGCGAPAAQTVQTASYTVTLRLEGAGIGERTATIEVADRQGRPVAADVVVVAPVMRDMGMAAPEVAAAADGAGRYTARAAFFSMLGEWELDVRIGAGGAEETAVFPVTVQ